jgi:hypothetical protein
MVEWVNSCMKYLIHSKNLCKCHSVLPPGIMIEENKEKKTWGHMDYTYIYMYTYMYIYRERDTYIYKHTHMVLNASSLITLKWSFVTLRHYALTAGLCMFYIISHYKLNYRYSESLSPYYDY